ncbi:hypothetical protein CcCBS67573_g09340 [Chytriomyces confervae]|uniref:60S ribosomal protein L6 n=1 Tax=Chytriomyces confervae TaxID=246404 RepID=A0A507DYI9_9FUNG|nr:hypothetical protein CcCBS67573_g09340 [Chytriomyces confervae]
MTKNPALIPGVATLSRSAAFKNKGLFNRKKAASAKQAAPAQTLVKKVGGAKNGGSRTVPVQRIAKFYPAEDVPKNKVTRKTIRPAATRSSITPGTVLILVAGRFAGKRVVFLKTLDSGLLLVSGPFKINGVPLRRVNQAFVIATSAKVDISKKKTVDAARVADQKSVDAAIIAAVKKTPLLKAYLNASFALSKGQAPHLIKY